MKILVIHHTHGNEIDVTKLFTHNLDLLCGNPRAWDAGVRFTETDLNRSFGVEVPTSYEEKRAKALEPILAEYDFVLDVHSTMSGETNAVISVHDTPLEREMAQWLAPNYVYIKHDMSLVSKAKNGLVLELGGHKSFTRYQNAISNFVHKTYRHEVKCWEAFDTFARKSRACSTPWRNYDAVRKGDVVGVCDGVEEVAMCDFVPFLWGENAYKDMYGFMLRPLQ